MCSNLALSESVQCLTRCPLIAARRGLHVSHVFAADSREALSRGGLGGRSRLDIYFLLERSDLTAPGIFNGGSHLCAVGGGSVADEALPASRPSGNHEAQATKRSRGVGLVADVTARTDLGRMADSYSWGFVEGRPGRGSKCLCPLRACSRCVFHHALCCQRDPHSAVHIGLMSGFFYDARVLTFCLWMQASTTLAPGIVLKLHVHELPCH